MGIMMVSDECKKWKQLYFLKTFPRHSIFHLRNNKNRVFSSFRWWWCWRWYGWRWCREKCVMLIEGKRLKFSMTSGEVFLKMLFFDKRSWKKWITRAHGETDNDFWRHLENPSKVVSDNGLLVIKRQTLFQDCNMPSCYLSAGDRTGKRIFTQMKGALEMCREMMKWSFCQPKQKIIMFVNRAASNTHKTASPIEIRTR